MRVSMLLAAVALTVRAVPRDGTLARGMDLAPGVEPLLWHVAVGAHAGLTLKLAKGACVTRKPAERSRFAIRSAPIGL